MTKIRKLDFNINIGNEECFYFENSSNCTSKLAFHILYNFPKNFSPVLEKTGYEITFKDRVIDVNKTIKPEIFSLKFNIESLDEIDKAILDFIEIQKAVDSEFIITGTNKEDIDKILLPMLIKNAKKPMIFGCALENNYNEISKPIVGTKHCIITRTPIDINLAKELNILVSDIGISKDKILIDPNVAALGYGLDYAYSIIERIKQAGLNGDEYLNMPIIAFCADEIWKVKEVKSDDFDKNWGELEKRALCWEATTAMSFITAGANIVCVSHKKVYESLTSLLKEQI